MVIVITYLSQCGDSRLNSPRIAGLPVRSLRSIGTFFYCGGSRLE
jgi:hypothetical protein